MALKSYNQTNVTNHKQFTKAIKDVFAGVAARNKQIQQLLIIAVNEAARESGGQVVNNLTWLSELMVLAEDTKGINATKLSEYVRVELCCNTVGWDKKTRQLKKKAKDTPLKYNLEPAHTWFDHGKPDTIEKAFDYGKRIESAISNALDPEKGGMTFAEVIKHVAQTGITVDDLIQAIQDNAEEKLELIDELPEEAA